MNKGMPYSLEAEQSLLGCMLMDNEIVSDVIDAVQESDFYVDSHKIIYGAIVAVYRSRKALDIITLTDELETSCRLGEVGGIAYITELAQAVPSAANYFEYLEIVRRDGLNRRMLRAAGEIAEYAKQGHAPAETISFAEEKVYRISEVNSSSATRNVRNSDGLDKVLEKFQKLSEDNNAYRGVTTGFTRLDRLTNGLQKQNLIVLAARPGMGKTSLAMNIIEHAAFDGKVCAVFSLEMSEEEILQRLTCSVANVNMSSALGGKLSIEQWRRLIRAREQLGHTDININDSASITPARILSECRRIKARNGGRLDLVMVDYIQLMHASDIRQAETRVLEVASITRDLKCMAKELDVPVLALSQLRRPEKGEKKPPQLSDLRDSGAIEQDADLVMFIERPDAGLSDDELENKQIIKGAAYLTVAKNRHGGLDKIPLRFKGELTKFVNPELNEELIARAERK